VSEATSGRIVTFGEAMVRLTPPGHERLERADRLDITVGGAELNTAATLACLEVPVSWVSTLPRTPLGRLIARGARAAGVETSAIRWVPETEGRAGVYLLEEGTDPRPSAVHYDRAGSAFARLPAGGFDWQALLKGASGLHISGITPALGDGPRAETAAAMHAAKAAGVAVGFDLNYRSKLWGEEDARRCFAELAPLTDVLFTSRSGLRTFFGIDGDHAETLRLARERIGVGTIVLSRKRSKASRSVRLGSVAMGSDGEVVEGAWRTVEVVDRLGGGDAFAGGFLAGYVADPSDLPRALALGGAAQALKHTMPGDFLTASREEIEGAIEVADGGVLER